MSAMRLFGGVMLALLASGVACAGVVDVTVNGPAGPATEAVVWLQSPQAATALKPVSVDIDQRNTQFTPQVSVITAGSQVRFPNSDNVRHQVYSFSPAKRFELPLYSGKAATPVLFDKPGIVELGCNIHDWMLAYVVVVDTPYHGITDAKGRVSVQAPPGRYSLRVWHPGLAAGTTPPAQDVVVGNATSAQTVMLALADRIAPPAPADDKLRALQEKFRKLQRDR